MADKEYIERGALLDMIAGNTLDTWGKGIDRAWWSHSVMVKDNFVRLLKDAPAADVVEVRHGEWEIVIGSNGKEKMVCTNCRHQQDLASTFTYCPNCGARMSGAKMKGGAV